MGVVQCSILADWLTGNASHSHLRLRPNNHAGSVAIRLRENASHCVLGGAAAWLSACEEARQGGSKNVQNADGMQPFHNMICPASHHNAPLWRFVSIRYQRITTPEIVPQRRIVQATSAALMWRGFQGRQ